METTFYSEPFATLHTGDCLEVLAGMEAESIQCCVTSPPFWGLRKYEGNQERVWGGRLDCTHSWAKALYQRQRGSLHGANAQAGNTLKGVSGVGLLQFSTHSQDREPPLSPLRNWGATEWE